MNKPDPHSNEHEQDNVNLTENCKNQCLQYLLDELDPEQLAWFEERLGKSDLLVNELQRQAEMIVSLSEVSSQPNAISGPGNSTISPNENGRSQKLLRRGFGIAIAVCAAVFVFRTWWPSITPPQGSESPDNKFAGRVIHDDANMTQVSEATLIARAWATAQVDDQDLSITPNTSRDKPTDVQFINTSTNELELETVPTEENSDDSFSWMFTATFEIHELETNDG
ncbi:MAG: hypothetical protein ACR2OA_07015 [Rubripirellula sp.]